MKIEEDTLILDEPVSEYMIEEFYTTIEQPQISKIIVENDDLHAGIIQILWCIDKEVEVKSDFLKPFFENVKRV